MLKHVILCAACALLFTGCGRQNAERQFVGEWVQAVPGMEGEVQGVKLEAGGKASSVNMQTLVYENWSLHGDSLVLEGKSVGNGQTVEFAENFRLKQENGVWKLQSEDASVEYVKTR